MARVVWDHVTKAFGSVVALDNLCLTAEDREFLVLVGPSGCGKSTALRLVAGLELPTSGEIFIGDRPVTSIPPRERDIAMVFQSYALYPHMSVYDNLAFGLKMRRFPKPEIAARVGEAAAILGIETLLARKPRQLSGGQRQRVALGRAIVREPLAFLMDEPLSNLDAQLRVQTRTELIKLHRRLETTVIYVTHDQVEAMTMGTRIAVMRDGVLQQLAAPQDLYDSPANTFVAGFIGSPAMNFFPGRLRQQAGSWSVDTDTFEHPVPPLLVDAVSGRTDPIVILGARPEHIQLAKHTAPADGKPFRARADVVELLGNEIHVYFTAGPLPLVARLDPRTAVRAGEEHELILAPDRVHLFDAASTKRLTTPAGVSASAA
ncbi:MAG: ABC transporter ATP-binding protein [Chloroflexi bacterium]|nr:ABC transporter ATP-binding protein [Chloroflexota bacterium]